MELVSCRIINCPPLTTVFHPTGNLTVINLQQTIPQCNPKFHLKPQQLDCLEPLHRNLHLQKSISPSLYLYSTHLPTSKACLRNWDFSVGLIVSNPRLVDWPLSTEKVRSSCNSEYFYSTGHWIKPWPVHMPPLISVIFSVTSGNCQWSIFGKKNQLRTAEGTSRTWTNDRSEWLACKDLVVVCPSSVPLFERTAGPVDMITLYPSRI